ncbi:MAG: ABC transporter permease, partial [Mesorhizobium sp.]
MTGVEAIRGEARERGPGVFRTVVRQLYRNRLGMLGAVLVGLVFASAIFAPLIITHDPTRIMVGPRLAGPSLDFLLGTDQLGRDTFSRVIMGGRIPLLVA